MPCPCAGKQVTSKIVIRQIPDSFRSSQSQIMKEKAPKIVDEPLKKTKKQTMDLPGFIQGKDRFEREYK